MPISNFTIENGTIGIIKKKGNGDQVIKNQWYAILESSEIKTGKIVSVTRMGEKITAWRSASGEVSLMVDRCPHRGVALSAGKIQGDCIQCPFHGFEYDTHGACTLVPANGKNAFPPKALHVQTYPSRDEHGFIYIWWGEAHRLIKQGKMV
jgi:phenylpropionate dioxygenase-like ring-hydroxylating dioxygenase large terminal subunit